MADDLDLPSDDEGLALPDAVEGVDGLDIGSAAAATAVVERPAPTIRGKIDRHGVAMGTGRRKTAVARVRVKDGRLERCEGGEAGEYGIELQKSAKQIEAATNDIDAVWKRIAVEEARLAAMLDINAGLIEMTMKNGEKRKVLAHEIVLEDLDTSPYDIYSHQNEHIVRLTPEQLKQKMAEKEAKAASS